MEAGDELLACRGMRAAVAACAIARQRIPANKKAKVPLGDVRPDRRREPRRMNRMAASDDTSSVRRNARTVTATWRAKTPRTAGVVESNDMFV